MLTMSLEHHICFSKSRRCTSCYLFFMYMYIEMIFKNILKNIFCILLMRILLIFLNFQNFISFYICTYIWNYMQKYYRKCILNIFIIPILLIFLNLFCKYLYILLFFVHGLILAIISSLFYLFFLRTTQNSHLKNTRDQFLVI